MPLIRPADSKRVSRQAMVLDLGDLRRHGEELVARAKSQAEQVVVDARAERERLIKGAREEGFAAGRAEGAAKGLEEGKAEGIRLAREEERERISHVVSGWSAALAAFESSRSDLLASAKEDLLGLAAEIGERVIRRSIELDPALVREQIDAAVMLALHATRLVVRVNPDDRGEATELMPELLKRFGGEREAIVEDDPTLTRGSCIVRTDRGVIDATIDTQISRVIEAFLPTRPPRVGGDAPSATTPIPPRPDAAGSEPAPASPES